MQLLNSEILLKLNKLGIDSYMYNTRQIQSFDSDGCGYYCVAFILALTHDYSYSNFLKIFSPLPTENEKIVTDFIKKFI